MRKDPTIQARLADPAMNRRRDIRDVYRRHAEACLAVLTKTTNPASRAMLTAMAHTWLRLAESRLLIDPGNAAQYRRNADEARRRVSDAEPQDQALWLRLADSWIRLLGGNVEPSQSHTSDKVVWPAKTPRDSQSWH